MQGYVRGACIQGEGEGLRGPGHEKVSACRAIACEEERARVHRRRRVTWWGTVEFELKAEARRSLGREPGREGEQLGVAGRGRGFQG